MGASGDANIVRDTDRFNIGSISKVVAAHVVGAMIDAGTPRLSWSSTLGQIMPELAFPNPVYKGVTIDQYSAHVSGMPYTPSNEATGPYEPANDANSWTVLGPLATNAIARRLMYVIRALKDPPITKCNQPDSNCQNDGDHRWVNGGIHDPGVTGEAVASQVIASTIAVGRLSTPRCLSG